MEITPRMLHAVSMLYEGKTKTEIATALKITPSTLTRWMNDPDFKAATVSLATQQIGDLVPSAVCTLSSIMSDSCAKPSDKLNAAKTVLEYARILDRNDLDNQVTLRVEYV